jgi:hypothetical protein
MPESGARRYIIIVLKYKHYYTNKKIFQTLGKRNRFLFHTLSAWSGTICSHHGSCGCHGFFRVTRVCVTIKDE